MECKQPDKLNLLPYFLFKSNAQVSPSFLYGFKDNLAVLGPMDEKMSVKKCNMEIKKTTRDKFIVINGTKLKVVMKNTLPDHIKKCAQKFTDIKQITEINRADTDKVAESRKTCELQSVSNCQSTMYSKSQQSKEVQAVTEHREIGCQTDFDTIPVLEMDELMQILMDAPVPLINSTRPVSSLIRKENDPKVKFYNDIRSAVVPNANGNMPIHVAVLDDDFTKVKRFAMVLKVLHRSIDIPNQTGHTALHLAVLNECNLDILRFLLDNNADLTATDPDGNTALHLAVSTNQEQVLEILCKYAKLMTVELDFYNYDGFTPLIMSSIDKNLKCAEILLKHGSKPNAQDQKSGRTALFHAAENHHLEMVQLLLVYKADTSIRNFFGTSPHDAMFEMEDIPQDIRTLIWQSKKRKNKNEASTTKPKILRMVKTYQKVK